MPLELHRYEVPDSRADRSAREGCLKAVGAFIWLAVVVLVFAASCS
jgi:hypothetical protein